MPRAWHPAPRCPRGLSGAPLGSATVAVVSQTQRRRLHRSERDARARSVAEAEETLAHRAQLRAVGITRADVRTEVEAGRWQLHGRHSVALSAGPLSPEARRWQAVWESGAGALLDGAAALLAAGVTGFVPDRLDVSLPHANRAHRLEGVRLHRRRTMPPRTGAGLPRVAPAVAAIHAASWAVSDRQAGLLLCLPVQQRLVRGADLTRAVASTARLARGGVIRQLVQDIADGAHSLGELDVARLCRRAGLPAPTRQAVRSGPSGRAYLDLAWEDVGLVVEVDGGHHGLALNAVDDALRQNELTISKDRVLRVPLIGLRLQPEAFIDQIVRAYRMLAAEVR